MNEAETRLAFRQIVHHGTLAFILTFKENYIKYLFILTTVYFCVPLNFATEVGVLLAAP